MFIKNKIKVLLRGYRATSESYLKHLRKLGVRIGDDVQIFNPSLTHIDITAPYLLEIQNHVMMTGPITILTHDYGWSVLKHKYGDICGNQQSVLIKNNVFIGWGSTVLCGTTIGENVIIGANSVVKGKIEDNSVYAGNPARRLMTLEEYYEKRKSRQLKEALNFVEAYKRIGGGYPPEEELNEYFYLFAIPETNNPAFLRQLNLMSTKEKSIEKMKEGRPFASYEDFLKYYRTEREV